MGNQGSETLGDWLRVTQSEEDELGVLVALAASWGHPGLLALPHWAAQGSPAFLHPGVPSVVAQ